MVDLLLNLATGLILLAILLSLYRFIKGPAVADRVMAFDVMTVSSIALMGIISYYSGRIIYLDVAMVYGLLSFLGVIIVARYLEKGF